jgi:hypothetical protein
MTNFQNEFQELFRFTFQETFSKSSLKQSSSEPENFVKLFSDSFSESFLFSFSKAYTHPSNNEISMERKPKEIYKEETKSTSGSSSSTSSRIKNRIQQKLKDNSSRYSLSLDELKKTPESKELRKSLSVLENKSVSSHFQSPESPNTNGLKGTKDALNLFPLFKENNKPSSFIGVTTSPIPLDEISGIFLDDSFGESLKIFSELEKKSESTTKNTIIVSNVKGEEKKKDIFSSKSFEILISQEFSNLFKKSINENKK